MPLRKDRFENTNPKEKKKVRDNEKKALQEKIFDSQKKTTWDLFSRDRDFKDLRRNYDKVFAKKFGEAYTKYIKGDWATAEDLFSQCLKINSKDGPTHVLKRYIE